MPAPETFTDSDIRQAIRHWLEYGESQLGKSQQGYFSHAGWAARFLRWHLAQLEERQKVTRLLLDIGSM